LSCVVVEQFPEHVTLDAERVVEGRWIGMISSRLGTRSLDIGVLSIGGDRVVERLDENRA